MSKDQEIYADIGRAIFSIAPENSTKVVFWAQVSENNDHATTKLKSLNENGEDKSFSGGSATYGLVRKIIELKKFFVSQGQPPWKSMRMTIDVQSGKFDVSFDYD